MSRILGATSLCPDTKPATQHHPFNSMATRRFKREKETLARAWRRSQSSGRDGSLLNVNMRLGVGGPHWGSKMGKVFEELRRGYPAIAADLLRPLLRLLHTARAASDGDMDKAIILLVLAIRAAEHRDFAGLSYEQIETGAIASLPNLGINLKSLAESTGIAKETVRRKVAALVQKGLVERRGRALAYTPAGLQAISGVRVALIRQALANHEVVDLMFRAVTEIL